MFSDAPLEPEINRSVQRLEHPSLNRLFILHSKPVKYQWDSCYALIGKMSLHSRLDTLDYHRDSCLLLAVL